MAFFFAGLALILAGGFVAVLARRAPPVADHLFVVLVGLGSVVGAVPALRVLAGGGVVSVSVAVALPGGPWVFGLDPLSAFFVLVFLGVGAASAMYGVAYLGAERGHRPVALAHLLVAMLIVSLALVAAAQAAVAFLVAWEVMAIVAYLLVVFESERAEARRAGLIYLVATHTGTLALFVLFATWGVRASDLTFASLAAVAPALPYGGAAVLVLGLVGFGVKAGLVPLHFWLPGAHAASPSHVSALMSGLVIKTGIYGLLRLVSLLGAPPAWWGWAVLALGLASGVLGVLWALAQHDLKRLLAYHSVENIGIILLGLGMGALGGAYHVPVVAVLGYTGAVLHVMNHAVFKSLLFLGAGSVARATGTRQIDRLGGLSRLMPVTWLTFLVASAAIVGLPPLNGFVSEWVVFQALLRAGVAQGPLRLAVFGAAGLGLIGALALACFAKVDGVVFLGRAREAEAAAAREVGAGMLVPMIALALACVLIGVAPVLVCGPALRAGGLVAGVGGISGLAGVAETVVAVRWIAGSAVALIAALGLGLLLRAAILRRRPVAVDETWGCGYAVPNVRMQYTASSFAAPLVEAYAPLAGVHVERSATSYATHARDPVLELALLRSWGRLRTLAGRLRPIQRGRLHVYLLYVVATVIALLVYLAAAGPAR